MFAVTAYGWACAGGFAVTLAIPLGFLEWDQRRHDRSEFSARFDLPLEES